MDLLSFFGWFFGTTEPDTSTAVIPQHQCQALSADATHASSDIGAVLTSTNAVYDAAHTSYSAAKLAIQSAAKMMSIALQNQQILDLYNGSTMLCIDTYICCIIDVCHALGAAKLKLETAWDEAKLIAPGASPSMADNLMKDMGMIGLCKYVVYLRYSDSNISEADKTLTDLETTATLTSQIITHNNDNLVRTFSVTLELSDF